MKKDYKYLDIAYSPFILLNKYLFKNIYIYINLYNLINILHSTCLFIYCCIQRIVLYWGFIIIMVLTFSKTKFTCRHIECVLLGSNLIKQNLREIISTGFNQKIILIYFKIFKPFLKVYFYKRMIKEKF